jgi:hypothetical protein
VSRWFIISAWSQRAQQAGCRRLIVQADRRSITYYE